MTNSSYIAHTVPLFNQHGVLRVTDMYKLKLLKFYHKLSYNLLPPYYDNYSETFAQKPARDLCQHLIHGPLIKCVYAECSPLFQLVKLINTLRKDKNDTILKKITDKTHSYNGFTLKLLNVWAFWNIIKCYLTLVYYIVIIFKTISTT